MVKILHDNDADMSVLNGKTVAVIGYGSQGSAQALCMRDSGVNVIIGSIKDASYDLAANEGFEVMDIASAAEKADIIHILLPDEFHGPVYEKEIAPHMKAGKALSCSHGFNIIYKQIVPPADVDVIMVAPKSPATEERKAFLAGFGVPGLIAVNQNPSGTANAIALAMAKAMGFTRAGCLECTFEQETYEDL
ncbi:MAG: ketol-acid reductoisomerase, partial [bacterium]|nr:ketol-acid reductoisomerase [bacterium]